ncbi:hypothetical protein TL16_g00636 [Triparma laevis f. inornata]|uniref:Uncharacterized protein n=1 Tax=Triparma laevis f. inornata TaxID=1714386 RepID=A0A9W7DN82_9STRA|nr:hypothetical protein TL16_g00636 [Triparma laevis f. inornata]
MGPSNSLSSSLTSSHRDLSLSIEESNEATETYRKTFVEEGKTLRRLTRSITEITSETDSLKSTTLDLHASLSSSSLPSLQSLRELLLLKERELEDLKKLEEETVKRIEREKVHFIGASEELRSQITSKVESRNETFARLSSHSSSSTTLDLLSQFQKTSSNLETLKTRLDTILTSQDTASVKVASLQTKLKATNRDTVSTNKTLLTVSSNIDSLTSTPFSQLGGFLENKMDVNGGKEHIGKVKDRYRDRYMVDNFHERIGGEEESEEESDDDEVLRKMI